MMIISTEITKRSNKVKLINDWTGCVVDLIINSVWWRLFQLAVRFVYQQSWLTISVVAVLVDKLVDQWSWSTRLTSKSYWLSTLLITGLINLTRMRILLLIVSRVSNTTHRVLKWLASMFWLASVNKAAAFAARYLVTKSFRQTRWRV